jgi:hypothetical protein
MFNVDLTFFNAVRCGAGKAGAQRVKKKALTCTLPPIMATMS